MDAQQVVMHYHEAWTGGDLVTARGDLADDLDFQGSVNTFRTAEAFMAVLGPFRKLMRGVTLLQAFYSENGAALLYDCLPLDPGARTLRTAEFLTVREGKIRSIRLVFDTPELKKWLGE